MAAHKLLAGAYDLHVHAAPDVVERRQDLWDLAEDAAAASMAGIALKDHTCPTQGRAAALNRAFPSGPRFYGCLALNPTLGGLNPWAVEAFLREGGTFVYLPTYGAANHIAIWGRGQPPTAFPIAADYPGDSILHGDGLKPQCLEIMALVKEHDAVLATGHISPDESLVLLRQARAMGLGRLLATHVSEPVSRFSPAQMAEAAELGALVEHAFFAVTPACPGGPSLDELKEQIAALGPGAVILTSDLGQKSNPAPVAGFAEHLRGLMKLGLPETAIWQMIKDNPRRLLE